MGANKWSAEKWIKVLPLLFEIVLDFLVNAIRGKKFVKITYRWHYYSIEKSKKSIKDITDELDLIEPDGIKFVDNGVTGQAILIEIWTTELIWAFKNVIQYLPYAGHWD